VVIPYRRFGKICRFCLHRSITQNTTALFWVIRQQVVVIPYRRFRILYPSHLHWSRIQKDFAFLTLEDWADRLSRNVAKNYHYSLRNNSEDDSCFLGYWPMKTEPTGCPETSVRNYRYSLRNNTEERSCVLGYWPMKTGPTGCPETSVRNYHYLLRNNPEERSVFWVIDLWRQNRQVFPKRR